MAAALFVTAAKGRGTGHHTASGPCVAATLGSVLQLACISTLLRVIVVVLGESITLLFAGSPVAGCLPPVVVRRPPR